MYKGNSPFIFSVKDASKQIKHMPKKGNIVMYFIIQDSKTYSIYTNAFCLP